MPTADEGRTLQLRLSLSSSSSSAGGTTSFKRSFEELFGGTDSDGEGEGRNEMGGAVVGNSNGPGVNGRNKRQRSESQSDQAFSPLGSSSSSSSSSSSALGYGYATTARRTPARTQSNTSSSSSLPSSIEPSLPPRLPTPRLDDVHMSDIPLLDNSVSESSSHSGAFQLTGSQYQPSSSRSLLTSTSTSTPPTFTTAPPPTNSTIPANEHATSFGGMGTSILGLGSSSQRLDLRSPSPLPLSLPRTTATSNNLTTTTSTTGIGTDVDSAVGPEERFRATMERYNAFESAIAALRRSVSPPGLPRSLGVGVGVGVGMGQQTASPPRLPPLELSSLQDDDGDSDERSVRPLGTFLSIVVSFGLLILIFPCNLQVRSDMGQWQQLPPFLLPPYQQ